MFTTVGGSAAAAGAVTGFMGSTVGAAAVIGGFGAGGAHVVGGKMARRVGEPLGDAGMAVTISVQACGGQESACATRIPAGLMPL